MIRISAGKIIFGSTKIGGGKVLTSTPLFSAKRALVCNTKPFLVLSTSGRLKCATLAATNDTVSSTGFTSLTTPRRNFFNFGKRNDGVKVDPSTFDKESVHYTGTMFGFDADNFMFFVKVGGGVFAILFFVHLFIKGYSILTRFSLQTVARMGFIGGFLTCLIGYTTVLTVIRRRAINANAVYNQSIALVMRHERVVKLLGSHPKTGEFKTYAASGGFKLPLLRRIRSGSYELSDFLALKPRRLQMLFVLKNTTTGYEGLVACDVRKESTGFLSSTEVFKSLSITLSDSAKVQPPETVVLIGRPEDVVYYSMLH